MSLARGRSLDEQKDLEWIFIGIHSLGVPIAIVMGVMHDPASFTWVATLAGLLGVWNVSAAVWNHRIASVGAQIGLGVATQMLLAVVAWAFIFQFVADESTAAYAGFAVVIIEGAVRFGLPGSMVMGVVFALGLGAAMSFRDWEYAIPFSPAGYTFWTVLLLLIALAVGLVTEETRRERHRREALVRERTLLEERQRISRDLHDTVLKTLQGLAFEVHALKRSVDSAPALERAEHIQAVCQRSSQEIREIVSELRSEAVSEGIASMLSRLVEVWGRESGIETEFVVDGEDRPLPLLASYNLRNVLSEALVNVRKHASASRVSVLLELQAGELRLEIADDGKGMEHARADIYGLGRGEYGLLGMKERVEQMNGQFSIESAGGTRIAVSVPLAAAE